MYFKLHIFVSKLHLHQLIVEMRKIHVCFSLDIKHVTLKFTGINGKAYKVPFVASQTITVQVTLNFAKVR